jgi:hypothetical protein
MIPPREPEIKRAEAIRTIMKTRSTFFASQDSIRESLCFQFLAERMMIPEPRGSPETLWREDYNLQITGPMIGVDKRTAVTSGFVL